jgi:hypothetical protein
MGIPAAGNPGARRAPLRGPVGGSYENNIFGVKKCGFCAPEIYEGFMEPGTGSPYNLFRRKSVFHSFSMV